MRPEIDINVGDEGGTTEVEAANFFEGVLHGFISPFTGLASLFDGDVVVYEDDAESSYAIGFVLGLVLIVLMLVSGFIGGRRYYVVRRY